MIVREATLADLPAILAIYNDAVVSTAATYQEEPETLPQRMVWLAQHQAEGLPVFVAEEQGWVVGWSSLNRFHVRSGWRFTLENSVYVAADARGRGIGSKLLAPLIEAAPRLGFRAILAVIDADNPASIALHQRFGFFEVGHFRSVGFKFGVWRDVIYLEKLVEGGSAPAGGASVLANSEQ
jgi:L-amino acid N-acyltransferase